MQSFAAGGHAPHIASRVAQMQQEEPILLLGRDRPWRDFRDAVIEQEIKALEGEDQGKRGARSAAIEVPGGMTRPEVVG